MITIMNTVLIFTLAQLSLAVLPITKYTNHEKNLIEEIFKNYNPNMPPFNPANNTNSSRTVVTVQLIVYGIRKVDLMDSTVTLKCSIRHWWNDTRTMWDPKDYGGIDTFWLKTDPNIDMRGWTPDFIIRQDAGERYLSNMKYTDLKVSSNGINYWSTVGDIKIIASFKVGKFPYDTQNLTITFGSWIYPDQRISMDLQNPPLVVYDPVNQWVIDNIEWEFLNYTVLTIKQEAISGTYLRFSYIIFIQRQGGTMLVAILIPGCLITFLGVLYYFLPAGGGERTSYLSTVLLTEIMFLVMLTSIIPQSREVPTLAWYYLSYTILLSILTMIVLMINKFYTVLKKFEKKYLNKIKQQYKPHTQTLQTVSEEGSQRNFFSHTVPVLPLQLKDTTRDTIDVSKEEVNTQESFMTKFKKASNQKMQQEQIKQKQEKYTQEKNQMKKKVRKYIMRVDLAVFLSALLAFIIITVYMIYQIFN